MHDNWLYFLLVMDWIKLSFFIETERCIHWDFSQGFDCFVDMADLMVEIWEEMPSSHIHGEVALRPALWCICPSD